jgi:hypothetical protein
VPATIVLLSAALHAGCGSPFSEVIWGAPSPDGRAHLLLQRDDFEGALGDYEYKVIVSMDLGRSGTLWTSRGCRPPYLFWLSETEIEILVDLSESKCRGMTQGPAASGAWREYRLVARPLSGWTKARLLERE